MNARTYNISMAVGLTLIGGGVGMVSIPAALVSVGGLIIALNLAAVNFARKG